MANYLVTGVAGFIASRVAACLLANGHAVVGIDNLNDAYDVRLKHWRLAQIAQHPCFAFHQLDICDRDGLNHLVAATSASSQMRFDAVINLAARAGVRYSVENPWIYLDTNTTGTLNLLEMCRVHNIQQLVLASTSSLYGSHNALPFCEDAATDQVLSPYAASKKAAEAMCYTYHHLYGLDVTVLRYFTVYGPAGRPDMSPFRFVQWISEERPVTVFGDGMQSRDFTYVDDIAYGTIASLGVPGHHVINLGSDQPVVLMDIIRLIEEMTGTRARLEFKPSHPADMPATWADIRKAKQILDWQPRTSFEEGFSQLVGWYRQERAWAKHICT